MMVKVFGRDLFAGNFLIPADQQIRTEVLRKLQSQLHSGAAYMPGYEEERQLLRARICALEAYDDAVR